MLKANTINALLFFMLFCSISWNASAQVKVSGKVTSSQDGTTLPGVSILEVGTGNGVITDIDGNYSIEISNADGELRFSFIGFEAQVVAVGSRTTVDLALDEDIETLDEVVVTGYGSVMRKTDVTGAISLVNAKELEKQPLMNASQALQGRAAGVQVIQNSGTPGSGLRIRVRGTSSISGSNDPLIVIDGVVDADLDMISPSDIESITVLKDASSAAIYGNRATNGVILVVTKGGKEGASVIEFGHWTSNSRATNELDYVSPLDYATLVNEAQGSPWAPVQLDSIVNAGGGYYQDDVIRNAMGHNYNLSISGKSGDINYAVSGSYYDQEGVVIGSEFKRYNARVKLNGVTGKWSYGTVMSATRRVGLNNSEEQSQSLDLIRNLGIFDPIAPRLDPLGGINSHSNTGFGSAIPYSPLWLATQPIKEETLNNLQTSYNLGYQVLDFLQVRATGGVISTDKLGLSYGPPATQAVLDTIGGNASNSHYTSLNWQYTVGLNFNKSFGEHKVNADVLFEERAFSERGFSGSTTNLLSEHYSYNNLGAGEIQNASTPEDKMSNRALRSFIARAVYGYAGKYNFTATIRHDETNVFPINSTGVFPAFAASWNINEESFLDVAAINRLTLRAGWGLTGNENIPTHGAYAVNSLSRGANNIVSQQAASYLYNEDLTWETTAQLNIGLDLGLFSNKIRMSAEYYKKNTTDILLEVPLPVVTGSSTQWINAGEIENKGFEITLDATPVDNGDLIWDIGFNLSANKTMVVALDGGREFIDLGSVDGENTQPVRLQPGVPLGSFYGFIYDGVTGTDDGAGNINYVANYVPNEGAEDDRFFIGDPNPDFIYGLNSSLSYKGFDLNIFIQGEKGGDIFNRFKSIRLGEAGSAGPGTHPDVMNTWSEQNPGSTVLPQGTTGAMPVSSAYIEDGSYLRLKNLYLGYTLPSSITEKMGLASLKFYVSGQNLFTITDYTGLDPEADSGNKNTFGGWDNGQFPLSKTYTIGLNLKF